MSGRFCTQGMPSPLNLEARMFVLLQNPVSNPAHFVLIPSFAGRLVVKLGTKKSV
jgi:hypothetical protein